MDYGALHIARLHEQPEETRHAQRPVRPEDLRAADWAIVVSLFVLVSTGVYLLIDFLIL